MLAAWAACLLAIVVSAHHLAKAFDRASEQAAQRRGLAANARVGGLAIALLVAGLAAAFVIGCMLYVGLSAW